MLNSVKSEADRQRALGTYIDAFQAENTLGRKDTLPFLEISGDIDVHRAHLRAGAAISAFIRIASDLKQGKARRDTTTRQPKSPGSILISAPAFTAGSRRRCRSGNESTRSR
ncbi:MAG: hypothetical protein N3D16_12765 [Anaerolineales bacterium]|nr:hypothetical protein [Anaerolineales bacterium]